MKRKQRHKYILWVQQPAENGLYHLTFRQGRCYEEEALAYAANIFEEEPATESVRVMQCARGGSKLIREFRFEEVTSAA